MKRFQRIFWLLGSEEDGLNEIKKIIVHIDGEVINPGIIYLEPRFSNRKCNRKCWWRNC